MKRKAVVAGVLSLLVPGLGQMFSGKSYKGAAVLAAAIVIGTTVASLFTISAWLAFFRLTAPGS